MDDELKNVFEALTDEELALFLSSTAFLPDADKESVSRIKTKTLQKAGLLPVGKEPAMKKSKAHKHLKTWLVAAALVVFIAFSAFAVVKYALPKTMVDDLSLDTNTVASDGVGEAVCKTNGLIFTLEGVTTGKLPEGYTFNGVRPKDDGCTYAIVSIRSEDGKPFWYLDDEKGYHADNFGFTILVNGYAPNPSMLMDLQHDGRYCYEDKDNNTLYWAYDITNALCFADRGVLLNVCNGMCSDVSILRINKDGGFYFEDSYPGIRVLFDLPLDPSLADSEKAVAWEQTGCFNTYEKIVSLFAEQGIDYDTIPYTAPESNP